MAVGDARLCVFEVEELLGDGHFEFVDLAEVREAAVGLAVEYNLAVKVHLEASPVGGSHLDGDIAGRVGLEEFHRQPRGDREVASSHAVNNLSFHLAVFGAWHISSLAYFDSVVVGYLAEKGVNLFFGKTLDPQESPDLLPLGVPGFGGLFGLGLNGFLCCFLSCPDCFLSGLLG